MMDVEGLRVLLTAFIGFIMLVLLLAIVTIIMTIVGYWKIFEKAGKPKWASFIPIYNLYVLCEVAGMPIWMFFLLFVPIVNLVIMVMLCINLAKAFGQGNGIVIGLILLHPIFLLILGFDNSTYCLNNN